MNQSRAKEVAEMYPNRRSVIDPIGATALGIAFARAVESDRPDRLFDDPNAGAFAAEGSRVSPLAGVMTGAGGRTDAPAPWAFLLHHVAVRTRFFDDFLADAVAGGCRQVVLLGAGLDARALRLRWPAGVRVFELDRAPVLEFKERVLGRAAAAPGRVAVPIDLRDEWGPALVRRGFEPGAPAAWLLEGLLPALEAAEADLLLDRLTALAAPGSRLALDETGDRAAVRRLLEMLDPDLVPLWKGPDREPAAWLAGCGWEAEVLDQEDVARGYGREAPSGAETRDWPRPRLIRARR